MKLLSANIKQFKGFTLIEVMLVIVMIGLMAAAIQFSFVGNKPEAKLQQESIRFAGIFDLAAEYALLNNVEIGLVLEKNSYQFLGFDGERWLPIPENDALASYQLPDEVAMELVLDDLPLEEPSLVKIELFQPDEDDFFEDFSLDDEDGEETEKIIIPQVYLLSGGDITPFRAEFALVESFDLEQEVQFHVVGEYTTPVKIAGPLFDGETAKEFAEKEQSLQYE